MPGSATLYTEQGVLGHTLAFATMAHPTGVFIGLAASAPPPTAATAGSEITGGAYARQPVTFALSTPSNMAANSATLEFPPATATWGTIGYFEVWDALTTGNRLYWGPLVDPADGVTPITRNVMSGDIVRFSAGIIQIKAT